MSDIARKRFKSELNSFFALTVLNIVFGALAMAFGMQFIITSVLGLTSGTAIPELRILTGVISMICFGLGLAWVLSSVRIFEGIETLKGDFDEKGRAITDDETTCLIVRMISQYRNNRDIIRRMILVCTLGGFCFLVLGLLNSLEFFSIGLTSGSFTLNNYLLIPSALLTLGVAVVSLASSFWFMKFSKTWDFRQGEIARSERELAEKLGRG